MAKITQGGFIFCQNLIEVWVNDLQKSSTQIVGQLKVNVIWTACIVQSKNLRSRKDEHLVLTDIRLKKLEYLRSHFKRNPHTFRGFLRSCRHIKSFFFHQSSKMCCKMPTAFTKQRTLSRYWSTSNSFSAAWIKNNPITSWLKLLIHIHTRNLFKIRCWASSQQLMCEDLLQKLPEETFISSSGAILHLIKAQYSSH